MVVVADSEGGAGVGALDVLDNMDSITYEEGTVLALDPYMIIRLDVAPTSTDADAISSNGVRSTCVSIKYYDQPNQDDFRCVLCV